MGGLGGCGKPRRLKGAAVEGAAVEAHEAELTAERTWAIKGNQGQSSAIKCNQAHEAELTAERTWAIKGNQVQSSAIKLTRPS